MKKILSLLLVLTMIFSLSACKTSEKVETNTNVEEETRIDKVVSAKDFPIVGSWINEVGKNCFRFYDDGSSLMEAVSNKTTNGTNKSFAIYQSNEYDWSINGDKICIGTTEYTPVENNGTYKLVGEKVTYIKVGDLDYELDLIFNLNK